MSSRDELKTPEQHEEEARGALWLTIGQLARYFKTPIPFFFDLTPNELDDWISVMNESIRRENDANKRAATQGG